MKFTVVWDGDAEAELSELWLETHQRQSVTDAANTIDRMLRYEPQRKGRKLAEGLRILEVEPLEVIFDVSLDDRVANIVVVRLMPPQP